MDVFSLGEEVDIQNSDGIWSNGLVVQLSDKAVRVKVDSDEVGWRPRDKVLKQFRRGDSSIRVNNRLVVR